MERLLTWLIGSAEQNRKVRFLPSTLAKELWNNCDPVETAGSPSALPKVGEVSATRRKHLRAGCSDQNASNGRTSGNRPLGNNGERRKRGLKEGDLTGYDYKDSL